MYLLTAFSSPHTTGAIASTFVTAVTAAACGRVHGGISWPYRLVTSGPARPSTARGQRSILLLVRSCRLTHYSRQALMHPVQSTECKQNCSGALVRYVTITTLCAQASADDLLQHAQRHHLPISMHGAYGLVCRVFYYKIDVPMQLLSESHKRQL